MITFSKLLKEAQEIVESKHVFKRFIDGTPLQNDIAVWMAEFAESAVAKDTRDVELASLRSAFAAKRKELDERIEDIKEFRKTFHAWLDANQIPERILRQRLPLTAEEKIQLKHMLDVGLSGRPEPMPKTDVECMEIYRFWEGVGK